MPGRTKIAIAYPVGTDVSKWQGDIDYAKAKASGISFVLIKTSQALYTDKWFEENRRDAGKENLAVGFYHFFDTDLKDDGLNQEKEALQQTDFFLSKILPLQPNEKWIALDLEKFHGDELKPVPTEASKARVRKLAEIFCNRVKEKAGFWPLLYVSPGTANKFNLGSSPILTQCPLWVAHWGPSKKPYVPKGWSTWYMWQFGGDLPKGTIPGIDAKVDLNALNTGFVPRQASIASPSFPIWTLALPFIGLGAYGLYKITRG